jgi:tRNA A-37 threonylcarbamoyl transferase component Bud32/membrane-associated phospholipid phosphatase
MATKDMSTPAAPGHHGAIVGAKGHRRRPSGQAPPLPRNLGASGRFWIAVAVYFALTVIGVLLFNPLRHLFDEIDDAILRRFVALRTTITVNVAQAINVLASRWTIRVIRWTAVFVLVVVRRWRHLIVYVGALLVLEIVVYLMAEGLGRPRPFGVTILGPWTGFSMPSRPLAGLAVSIVGALYALLPHGRAREAGKVATAVFLAVVIVARMILAVEGPSAAVFGAILGVAIGLVAFRWMAPNEVFPVTYRRGKAAHLDVGGRRGIAIVDAVRDQLGEEVVEIHPIGLEGSGGSTPLRLTIATDDGARRYVFAKLYAMNHVRADRWYKLGRQILYGALEDETPFGTVRRFVEYEDYALRLLHDQGFSTPEPYGVVEITPEREYMILMEFFDDAVEIGDAEVSDGVIDEGLQMIRRMWHVGVAHRDVKPANLMVQDGHLRLIDVFFVQVRPSPWRQAVDLANMMLVLALRSDAQTVYEHARRSFSEDEIAEAFAATRGVASPTQLRSMLKDDGRNLLAEFRSLAPHRAPIRIQRWSVRRIVLTVSVAFGLFLAVGILVSNWTLFA